MSNPEQAHAAASSDKRAGNQRTLSAVLAILLPMAIAWLGYLGLERLRTASDAREMHNVGRVINGRVLGEGGVVEMMERTLERTQPSIIILGNSLSNTDINPIQLAMRLGIPRHKIQRFSIPNSIGAHWWIVMKNRVYANGHTPRAVIMLSDMQSAIATRPLTEASYMNLRVHVDEPLDDAYLDAKAGSNGWASSRIWENKGKVRDSALKLVRNVWVELVFRRQLYTGQSSQKISAAIDRVFDAGSTDLRLHQSVIPIMQAERGLQPFDPSQLPKVEDSFIPEITTMVKENRGKAIFLRPPMSPLLAPELGDFVLPATEVAVRSLVAENGGAYLDMRNFHLTESDFYNVDHMNDRGAKRFTEAVALALEDLDVLGRGKKAREEYGREIQLFGDIKLVDGELVDARTPLVYRRDEPLPVPRVLWDPELKISRDETVYFDTPRLAFLSDTSTTQHHPFGARCSPVRVLENGVALPMPNVSCEEVFKAGKGRVCHTADRMAFAASDNTDPTTNGRTYTLALDPDRQCEGTAWLYPDDAFRVTFPGGRLGRMVEGARAFRLEAIDVRRPDSKDVVQFRLTAGDRVVLEESATLGSFDDGEREWAIEPPIPPDAGPVRLELMNKTRTFVLVTSAVLSERVRGIGN
jgi:hypothetical protein